MNTRPKILIVEDNEFNHKLYRDAFERAGFEVTIFQNADGFFADLVAELNPDIISMDIMIGLHGKAAERDGFEAIEALKADLRTHEIPIFVLTSFSSEEKVKRAKELGAVDFISTPSQVFTRIPDYFLHYLNDPEHHTPVHQFFR
jgi:CheY-like chemotaxis protein